MKAAIMVLECPGSSPCKAPSTMAVGTNSHGADPPCDNKLENSIMMETFFRYLVRIKHQQGITNIFGHG